ncbi:MAG: hypothetical protein ACTHU0_25200 [Kofleriaceae bacterium]
MKKISTLFAILALSTTIGLAGCKKKDEAKKDDTAAKPTEPAKADEPKADEPKAEPAKADEPKADEPAAAAAGDLPAECNEYKSMIEKLASCDKLPQASRDALKQAFDQASGAWAGVPAEGKAALATGCKTGADALKQAAASVCGW